MLRYLRWLFRFFYDEYYSLEKDEDGLNEILDIINNMATTKQLKKRYDELRAKHIKFEDRNTLLEGAERDDCIWTAAQMSLLKELLNIGEKSSIIHT